MTCILQPTCGYASEQAFRSTISSSRVTCRVEDREAFRDVPWAMEYENLSICIVGAGFVERENRQVQ